MNETASPLDQHPEPSSPIPSSDFNVLVLSDCRPPQDLREAQALLANASVLRAIGQTEGRPSLERLAEDQEAAAAQFLVYAPEDTRPVGAGGELVPASDDAGAPSLRDTVRNPDKTTAIASAERLRLANNAHSLGLAIDLAETIRAGDSFEKGLAHQMATTHSLAMRVAERVTRELDALPPGSLPPNGAVELARLINAQCRLMDAYQRAALTLAKKRNPNTQTIIVKQQIQATPGSQVAVAGAVTTSGAS
jgi:hypothetical protein